MAAGVSAAVVKLFGGGAWLRPPFRKGWRVRFRFACSGRFLQDRIRGGQMAIVYLERCRAQGSVFCRGWLWLLPSHTLQRNNELPARWRGFSASSAEVLGIAGGCWFQWSALCVTFRFVINLSSRFLNGT